MNYKYKRTDLVSEKSGGTELVLNHKKGTMITLNSTASDIYSLLKSPKTIDQIFISLEKKYLSISKDHLRRVIKDMEKARIIKKCINVK